MTFGSLQPLPCCPSSTTVHVLDAFASIPDPARSPYGINPRPRGKLINCQPGQRGIASPFALAGHDEIEVEFVQHAHALTAHIGIDAHESLVEQDQPRRELSSAAVICGGGSKLWDGQRQRFLTARTRAVCAFGESVPIAILFPFDVKLMPPTVVKGNRQLLLPRGGRLGLSYTADLLLEEIAEQHTVRWRPGGTFSHELFSGLVERR